MAQVIKHTHEQDQIKCFSQRSNVVNGHFAKFNFCFAAGDDHVAYPNLMFHFLPLAIRYDGTARRAATATRSTSDRCTRTPAAT